MERNQSHKEGQNLSLRELSEGRESRESVLIGKTPGSVRGLTKVQYPLRVN